MPTRRLPDNPVPSAFDWTAVCRNPDHDPPRMIVLAPGQYEHTCPACGRVVRFTIPTRTLF